MDNKHLTDGFKGYLTPKAAIALTELMDGGMDQDLAIILLEAHFPDSEIYQLEEE